MLYNEEKGMRHTILDQHTVLVCFFAYQNGTFRPFFAYLFSMDIFVQRPVLVRACRFGMRMPLYIFFNICMFRTILVCRRL